MSEIGQDLPLDSDLIKQTLEGDSRAFESLVVKYQPKIFGTARRYARRESEVEDMVQEVFLKAYQKLSTFRGDAPFEHWLMMSGRSFRCRNRKGKIEFRLLGFERVQFPDSMREEMR